MWSELTSAKNSLIGEAWQEFVEDSLIPCRVYWRDRRQRQVVDAPCEVLVPIDRKHVALLAMNQHLY